MTTRLPIWQRAIAYALIALPILWGMGGVAYPVPDDSAIQFYVVLALAVGASLFVVRRRREDVIAWLGLCGWDGLCAFAVVAALWRAH